MAGAARQFDARNAADSLRRSLETMPYDPAGHFQLARILASQGQWPEAAGSARRAYELDSRIIAARALQVFALRQIGRVGEADGIIRDLTRQQDEALVFWMQLGRAEMELGQHQSAIASFTKATQAGPKSASAWNDLAWACNRCFDVEGMLSAVRQAVELEPGSGEIRLNYAVALEDVNDLDESTRQFDIAAELDPENIRIHTCRANHHLMLGDLRRGFEEFEWRRKMKELQVSLPGPVWDGSDPRGRRILLHCEQGFGDSIQYCRFAPQLAATGAHVIMYCQRSLGRLFRSLSGVEEVFEYGQPLPQYDVRLPLLSLPFMLRTEMASLPPGPYLTPSQDEIDRWRRRLPRNGKLRVGLVWTSTAANEIRWRKFVPANMLPELMNLPGTEFFGLHVGPSKEDLAILSPPMTDLSAEMNDFSAAAAAMLQMDLVISVDTAGAHLAGAVGARVWVLLPWTADWRWMRNRSDSPWYPSAKLFRQVVAGDWNAPLAQIKQGLKGLQVQAQGQAPSGRPR